MGDSKIYAKYWKCPKNNGPDYRSVVEKEIEKIYEAYQLPPEVRILLESCIQEIISTERAKYDAELDGLKGEKAKLKNKRKKTS